MMPRLPGARLPAYLASRADEFERLDSFAAGPARICNVFGPGGIGKTVLSATWLTRATDSGLIAVLHNCAGGVASPGVLMQDMREQIARHDVVNPAAFGRFDEALREQLVLEQVLRQSGGASALFDVLGQLKDPAGITGLLAGVGHAVADRVAQRIANRAAFERYLRGAGELLAEEFMQALAELNERHPMVLVLDTYEDAQSIDDWMISHFAAKVPHGVHLLISGRDELTRTNFDWTTVPDLQHWPVPELPLDEAARYLAHYGLTQPRLLEHVLELTGGYPLMLMLITRLGTSVGWNELRAIAPRDRDEIATLLLERLLGTERARPLRQVLERGCLAPWLDPPIIAVLLSITPDEARALYDQLATHSFVERHPRGLRLHDKIRELLRARLQFTNPDVYQNLVSSLAAHLEARDRQQD